MADIASLAVKTSLDASGLVSGLRAADAALTQFSRSQDDAFRPRNTDVNASALVEVQRQIEAANRVNAALASGPAAVGGGGYRSEMEAAFNDATAQQRIETAQRVNQEITKAESSIQNSARMSAAVFEASFEQEARVQQQRAQQAIQTNTILTAQMSESTNSARMSAAVFEAAFEEQERADNDFTRSYVNNSAIRRRTILDETTAMTAAQSRTARATNQLRSFNQGQLAGSKAASRFGLVLQQGGYQMQDFAVQVAGGQSALVAFSQQGSQFAGFFGPQGAIIGAGLAVGVLIAQLTKAARSTKDLKTGLEDIMRLGQQRADLERTARLEDANPRERLAILEQEKRQMEDRRKQLRALVDQYSGFAKVVGNTRRTSGRRTQGGEGVVVSRAADEAEVAKFLKEQAELDLIILQRQRDIKKAKEEVLEVDKKQTDENKRQRDESDKRLKETAARSVAVDAAMTELTGTEQEKLSRLRADIAADLASMDDQRIAQGYRALQAIKNERDAILDQLDPMRARNREQERFNALVSEGVFTAEEAARVTAQRRQKLLEGIRLPDAMSPQFGASALGGVASGGTEALQTVNIQKQMLAALRTLVSQGMN
jgi:hypothetical protein